MKSTPIKSATGPKFVVYKSYYDEESAFEEVVVSRESIDSTVAAYHNSCAEMRSEARDAYIRAITEYSIYSRI